MLNRLGSQVQNPYLLMDRAYEGNETRQLALALGFTPVIPPLSTRVHPWEYDREMYKKRNEIERLFRRLKGFRRIFSRFEKLDVIFLGFISFALIFDALRFVWTRPSPCPPSLDQLDLTAITIRYQGQEQGGPPYHPTIPSLRSLIGYGLHTEWRLSPLLLSWLLPQVAQWNGLGGVLRGQ